VAVSSSRREDTKKLLKEKDNHLNIKKPPNLMLFVVYITKILLR
jgi:hypothetical protein